MKKDLKENQNELLQINKNSLSSLIGHSNLDKFKSSIWENDTLIVHRDNKEFYSELFSVDLVDQVLELNQPSGRSFSLVKNQEKFPPAKYKDEDGTLNLAKIYAAYLDGYTVVINKIEKYWNPINSLCRKITQQLSQHCAANMYLTPKNQKALAAHHDTHDIYILQIYGEKIWNIFDPLIETPLVGSHQPIYSEGQLSNKREITLSAGDFMYMPRGTPHLAYTNDQSSLHLTIGVYPSQWIDLIIESIKEQAVFNSELRKSIPIGYLRSYEIQDQIKTKVRELMPLATNNLNYETGLVAACESLRRDQRMPADGHFRHIDKYSTINSDTALEKRDLAFNMVQFNSQYSRIIFPGNTIKGPSTVQKALQFISANDKFIVKEIPVELESHKIEIAKKLLRGGLLKISNKIYNMTSSDRNKNLTKNIAKII